MASGIELATGYVSIVAETSGLKKQINEALNGVDDGPARKAGDKLGLTLTKSFGDKVDGKGAARRLVNDFENDANPRAAAAGARVGQVIGRGIGGGITAASKVAEVALKGALVGAAGVAAVAVGGVGLALTKGFQRLKSIDDAKFKLMALGNSAADVQKIMDSALASVKGTAFGLEDAATAAASAVAAGIQPGQDLTRYLKDVGDAAAIAGTNFQDMGSIFNKIQTSNKAFTDDLNQLSDRGLPIFEWLQKEYGVTGDKLSEMVQKGQVDAAHFRQAIETNISGAALKMGDSFSGSVANAEAALGRLGAALLKPLFVNAAGGLGSITEGLDSMTAWVDAHQPEIINFFKDVGVAAVTVAQDIVRSFGSILQAAGQFSSSLGSILDGLGIDNNLKTVGDNITGIGDKLVAASEKFDGAKDKIRDWAATASSQAELARAGIGNYLTALTNIPPAKNTTITASDNATPTILHIGDSLRALPDVKNVRINATTSGTVSAPDTRVSTFDGVPDPTKIGPVSGLFGQGFTTYPRGHHSGGVLPGFSPGKDNMLVPLAGGEGIVRPEVVRALGPDFIHRLNGFDTGGVVPDPLRDMMFGRGGQRDNWAEYSTYDPMQHMMMKRKMVGLDPSGLRTPGGGIFNEGMNIDLSNVSVSPAPKYGYDQWRLTFDDLSDATTYQEGERDNPSFYKKQAQLKNDPLGAWLLGGGAAAASGTGVGKLYDQGGPMPPGVTLANNQTGKPEYVLTPEQVDWLKSQGIDPAAIKAGMPPPPGMPGMPVMGGDGASLAQTATGGQDSGRTEGYIPASAGNTAPTGGGVAGDLFGLGAEAINGAIDTAAQVATMAATAGTLGAGGAGAAAGPGIQAGAAAAKRGVEFAAQLGSIGVGALSEILLPFGAPRWLSDVSPTSFMPHKGVNAAAVTSAEQQRMPQAIDPLTDQHGKAMGAPPGPMTGAGQPDPQHLEAAIPDAPIIGSLSVNGVDPNQIPGEIQKQLSLSVMQYGGRPYGR